jgi:hypothetical protein
MPFQVSFLNVQHSSYLLYLKNETTIMIEDKKNSFAYLELDYC